MPRFLSLSPIQPKLNGTGRSFLISSCKFPDITSNFLQAQSETPEAPPMRRRVGYWRPIGSILVTEVNISSAVTDSPDKLDGWRWF